MLNCLLGLSIEVEQRSSWLVLARRHESLPISGRDAYSGDNGLGIRCVR
jgi:hypothetical protein